MNIFRNCESKLSAKRGVVHRLTETRKSVIGKVWRKYRHIGISSFGHLIHANSRSFDLVIHSEDTEASEVVKISTGQLYLIRAGTIRSDRECMYATIPFLALHSSVDRFSQ